MSRARSSLGRGVSEAGSTRRSRAAASLVVALALWAATLLAVPRAASTSSDRLQTPGAPASAAAAPQRRPGLPNFGAVSDQLYRGAQPGDSGFAELERLGIAIVVNLRHERDRIERERTLVENLGMRYVSIPWRGHDDPRTVQVSEFLRLLRENPERRVFVHCRRGAERTGVMVACYRISREHWTPERAQAEMEAFGFRRRFAHLTRFVREFPGLLLREPVLESTIRP